MCGFLVHFSKNNKKNFDRSKFVKSARLISHRGPDDMQKFFHENINMIFYRLSIIDQSNLGSQPMFSLTKRYLIVFNGEIYNAKKLKKLVNQNHLRGNSDTEILINLYEKYGHNCVEKLEGMFSFFVYDFKKNNCFVARDRFGIKPLYFSNQKDFILIGSEIKPILSYLKNNKLNNSAIADFLIRQKMDHDNITFFENIEALEPCNFAYIDSKKIIKKNYWKIQNKISDNNFETSKKEYLNLFESSVKKHLISDRKIGLLFSAGTDSTMLATIMKRSLNYPVQTYTYDFINNKFGDSHKSKIISKKLKIINKSTFVRPSDVINDLTKVCLELESPFTSIRIFGVRKALMLMKKDKLSVVFEGGGGDEILGGYEYNLIFHYLDLVKKNKKNIKFFFNEILKNKNKLINYLVTISNQFGSIKDCTPFVNINNFNINFLNDNINEKFFFTENFPERLNFLQKSQYTDIKFVNLPRSLKYSDRLSMNQGLENRVPFLDHKLAKFCFNLPNQFKIKNNITRYISKESIKKYSDKNFFANQKKTITDPQSEWLRTSLKNFANDTFNSTDFKNCDFFDYKNVKKNFDFFLKNPKQTSFDIFQILSTFYFYKSFKSKFNC